MDEIIFFGGLILFFLFGPWVVVWVGRRRRKREREEDRQRWGELTRRVYALEEAVRRFQSAPKAEIAAPAIKAEIPETHRETRAPEPAPPKPPAIEITASASRVHNGAEAGVRQSAAARLPLPAPSSQPAEGAASAYAGSASAQRSPSVFATLKSCLDLEEALGTNWLNKIGISILVLGVAFFLVYQLRTLGPAGKVLVGYGVSAFLLGAGLWLERGERYRILARAGIGGGWALLFFTSYAMYHVPAAHLIDSQIVDLLLMLMVAAAMVWHTLGYQSQVVTGLAFLLAFLTVTISHETVYSLSAGGILAAALVVIVVRMQWFELEIFGILASYFNHYLWVRPTIEAMNGRRKPFPEFAASAGILCAYWAIFRTSYVFRQPRDARQEHLSTAAALLNTVLLLALLKYQSVHPEWAFWALLAIGAVETLLGQLPIVRKRRSAAIVLSTLGVILLIAAFPFRYSGTRLAVLWLWEAEALLLIGVWTREVIFRRLGLMAMLLVAGQMISVDAARVAGRRMDGADERSNLALALMFAIAAAVFYANSHWVLRRWNDLFSREFDHRLMRRLSYVAAVVLFIGAWIAFPKSWAAVAWSALGLLLLGLGHRFRTRDLGYQANAFALAVFFRVLAINLAASDKRHGLSLRLITISLVAVLLYLSSRWAVAATGQGVTIARSFFSAAQLIRGSYTWAASFLLALLTWYELRPVGVAVIWATGGLLLFELGLTRRSLSLRLQAYLVFLASFLRIFYVNLNAAGLPGEVSPRFYTVVPLALVFFYAYWRLHENVGDRFEFERKLRAEAFCCYLGTLTIAALMRFELEADWVAAGWAALAFLLMAIAWRSKRRVFLHQALLVIFGVLFRTGLHNFYQRSYFPAPVWESRSLSVGVAVALGFASLLFALRLRTQTEITAGSPIRRAFRFLSSRPEQVFFFIAVGLLTVLLALEMRHGMVTLSWGLEGLAIFMFALWVGERSFRLSGLGLLLLCVGKILVVDVWRLNPRDRYLTLIVLGAALLLVSFLYTRNREAIRQYL
jgi:Predicted membrane protein (DUF2339)